MTMFRLNAGKYRHPITIQKLVQTENSYGETTDEWIDETRMRAGIYPLSGKEFFSAEAVNSEITHKVHIRYISGITSDMRIIFNERIFNIISAPINWQEKNVELQLLCKETT
jgi:SPP1 family predicted phage head-tail adaptor